MLEHCTIEKLYATADRHSFTDMEVDVRGHSMQLYQNAWYSLLPYLSSENIDQLADAWKTGIPAEKMVRWELPEYSRDRCNYCHSGAFETDGFHIRAADPCPYPEGLPVSVDLAVPSGRMVIGNDFRDTFQIDDDEFDVNAAYGIKQTIDAYADIGMLHFYVGNSCPSVYRTSDGSFVIGTSAFDGDDNELAIDGEEVAGVCTDLWWVSIVDGDEADRRGLDRERFDTTEVVVEPGVYRLEYRALMRSFDRDDETQPIIYAELVRYKDI